MKLTVVYLFTLNHFCIWVEEEDQRELFMNGNHTFTALFIHLYCLIYIHNC